MDVPRKVGALVFLGSALAAGCTATPDTSAQAPCPAPPAEAARTVASRLGPGVRAEAGDASRGGELLAEHCDRCHSPDVAARESRLFREYPRLDCDAYLAAASDEYLGAVIEHGGEPFGMKSVMKPWGDKLGDPGIADVLAHLRRAP